ncbi:death-associated protein 1-like isoform X2 [Hypanus sabinus]|uniref:death-associated protein 1-like isoform X2 n=1 Tax=Hypanus sabinus TaxID=79690 RepID=UPI0028C3A6FD|nr:death-associated protein 1-like isoform X2 [Hypanus sabinus]
MSSPPREKVETKAGHPPAVKAGGMRIVKKHQGSTAQSSAEKDKESEDWETNRGIKTFHLLLHKLPTRSLLHQWRNCLFHIRSIIPSISLASEESNALK